MAIEKGVTPKVKTLETGTLTFQIFTNGETEVEISGTFGSVVLGSSTQPTLAARTITTGERFVSEMTDMLFTLTGAGPVVVSVAPINNNTFLQAE